MLETMNIYNRFLWSCIVFILGVVFAVRKRRVPLNHVTAMAVIIFAFFFYTALFVVAHYFTGRGIDDSVMYHIEFGLEGAGFMEYLTPMLGSFITLGLAIFLPYRWLKASAQSNRQHTGQRLFAFYVAAGLAFYLSPTTDGIIKTSKVQAMMASEGHERDDFDQYYQPPSISKSPAKKPNLIYIYAESLERTYFDEKLFPGLIKHLRELEGISTYFTDMKQVNSTGWTLAGMVASQCGVPLFGTASKNSMTGLDKFMPDAVCMGDLLSREGYSLSYLGGAKLEFAGKGKFYTTHSFDSVSGLLELQPKMKDPDYVNTWGLYDDTLFEFVEQEFDRLTKQDKPFGLFALTLDTHNPDGHASESCEDIPYGDGSNPILNSVACSDYLISRFVKKVMNSQVADNTVIVVASDHLALRNSATDLLREGKRHNTYMIITPDRKPQRIERVTSMMDGGATVLSKMGFEAQHGLGRDMSNPDQKALVATVPKFNQALNGWSHRIRDFWDFPVITASDSILIDTDQKTIQLQGRTYRAPLLLYLNKDLSTTIKFPRVRYSSKNQLGDHLIKTPDGARFLWADKCSSINTFGKNSRSDEYCLMYGKKGGTMIRTTFRETQQVAVADILSADQTRVKK